MLLVDSLTLWLSNPLCLQDADQFARERPARLDLLPELGGDLIMVTNETNSGVIPVFALVRRYCDEAGRLHQDLAARCDTVVLTVAGLPHVLKGSLP